jgi:starvation-inducible DNA-binding protein
MIREFELMAWLLQSNRVLHHLPCARIGAFNALSELAFNCLNLKSYIKMADIKLISALNTMLADMHVLVTKLHNYHWNVSGMQFHAIHNATESYYDYFFGQFDDVAERILQLGEKPLATVKGYLAAATLEEDEGSSFEPAYVLEKISADFTALLGQAKAANGLAEEAGDVATLDLLGGLIAWLEKELWIIRSSLG